MGKKTIITKEENSEVAKEKVPATVAVPKKKVSAGVLNIEATFNNTKLTLADKSGNTLAWSSAGSIGFSGTKKGTPFAASKVGDSLAEKALTMGIKEVDVVIRGVGPGREPALRGFMGRGIEISSIHDSTPIPHNGCRARKRRRV